MKSRIIFFFTKILLICLVFTLTNKYVFGFYIVKSTNYKSININPHDFLIYYKLQKEYQYNDIVFYNSKIYRIVGIGGQIIANKNGKVLIDNNIIERKINYNYSYPYTIKNNEVFLLSDSDDSAIFGCINISKIKGKLIFRLQIRDF